jgi:hypothetical protein
MKSRNLIGFAKQSMAILTSLFLLWTCGDAATVLKPGQTLPMTSPRPSILAVAFQEQALELEIAMMIRPFLSGVMAIPSRVRQWAYARRHSRHEDSAPEDERPVSPPTKSQLVAQVEAWATAMAHFDYSATGQTIVRGRHGTTLNALLHLVESRGLFLSQAHLRVIGLEPIGGESDLLSFDGNNRIFFSMASDYYKARNYALNDFNEPVPEEDELVRLINEYEKASPLHKKSLNYFRRLLQLRREHPELVEDYNANAIPIVLGFRLWGEPGGRKMLSDFYRSKYDFWPEFADLSELQSITVPQRYLNRIRDWQRETAAKFLEQATKIRQQPNADNRSVQRWKDLAGWVGRLKIYEMEKSDAQDNLPAEELSQRLELLSKATAPKPATQPKSDDTPASLTYLKVLKRELEAGKVWAEAHRAAVEAGRSWYGYRGEQVAASILGVVSFFIPWIGFASVIFALAHIPYLRAIAKLHNRAPPSRGEQLTPLAILAPFSFPALLSLFNSRFLNMPIEFGISAILLTVAGVILFGLIAHYHTRHDERFFNRQRRNYVERLVSSGALKGSVFNSEEEARKAVPLAEAESPVPGLPNDPRFLYRGMRIKLDSIGDILRDGMPVSKTNPSYGGLWVAKASRDALGFALFPGEGAPPEDFVTVVVQLDRREVDVPDPATWFPNTHQTTKDIPANGILRIVAMRRDGSFIDIETLQEIEPADQPPTGPSVGHQTTVSGKRFWVSFAAMVGLALFAAFRLYGEQTHHLYRHFHNLLPNLMPPGSLLFQVDHGLLNDFMTILAIVAVACIGNYLGQFLLWRNEKAISDEERARHNGKVRFIYHQLAFWGVPLAILFWSDPGSRAAYVIGGMAAILILQKLEFARPHRRTPRSASQFA